MIHYTNSGNAHAELWHDVTKYLPSVVLPRLTGLLTLPIITRLFPPGVIGMYMLVMASTAILSSATMTGLGATVLRFLPEYDNDQEARNSFLFTILVSGSIIAAITGGIGYLVLAMLPIAHSPAFSEMMRVGLLLFIVSSMFTLISLVLRSRRMVGTFSATQIVNSYGGLVIGLLLILVWRTGISGLLWGNIVATGLAIIPCWFIATSNWRMSKLRFSSEYLRHIASFAIFVSMGNAAYWLLSLSDRWLLKIFRSTDEVGLYSVSYDLTGKTTFLLITAFSLALQPLTVSVWEKRGKQATEQLIRSSTRSFILLILPATVGLSILAQPVLLLLTSPAYTSGAVVIPFIALSMFLFGLVDLIARGLTLAKRANIEARNLGIAGIVNFILNIILIPMYGYVAAAITTLVGYICLILLHTMSIRPYIKWRFPWQSFGKAAVACVGMSAIILSVDSIIVNVSLIFRLLFLIVIGITAYVLVLILTKEISLKRLLSIMASWRYKAHPSGR